jgi:deazaflavin-dependent oxidoreductase (nitroreductase family)
MTDRGTTRAGSTDAEAGTAGVAAGPGDPAGRGEGDTSAAVPTTTLEQRIAFSSHGRPWLIVMKPTPRGKAIDRFIARWTGESLLSLEFAKAAGRPYLRHHLLLTTIGSKTGEQRTSLLPYFRYGDELVVCGTKGGGPLNPYWVGNIAADPHCWIRIRRRLIPAVARVTAGAERQAVFAEVAKQHLDLERYQAQTEKLGRDIPLVLITPRGPLPPSA